MQRDIFRFTRRTLDNGIPVYLNLHLPVRATMIGLVYHIGSYDDPEGKSGLAHFMEHMPFRGTRKFPSKDALAQPIENEGGMLNAWTSTEKIVFLAEVHPDDLALGIHALCELTQHAVMRPEDLSEERGAVSEEWKIAFAEPANYAERICREHVFAGHPLRRLTIGDLDAIRAFTIDDIRSFYGHMRTRAPRTVLVAGSGNAKDILASLNTSFSRAPYVPVARKSQPAGRETGGECFEITDQPYANTHLMMGARGYSAREMTLCVAADVLSVMMSHGLTAPLFRELREKRGLVYGSRFSHDSFSDNGFFTFNAPTSSEHVPAVRELFFEVLTQTSRDAERFNAVKRLLRKKLEMRDIDLFHILHSAAEHVVEGGRAPLPTKDRLALIEKATLEDVRAVVDAHLKPENFVTVTVKSQNE